MSWCSSSHMATDRLRCKEKFRSTSAAPQILLRLGKRLLGRMCDGDKSVKNWGGAVSKDLIHWEDQGGWQDAQALAIGPSGNGSYDGLGIFSGSALSSNVQGLRSQSHWDLTGFRDPFIEPNPELDALRGVEKHFYAVWGSGIKNYAYNFELSGFFHLKDRAGKDHWYVNMGTEGGGGADVPFHTNAQWQLYEVDGVTNTTELTEAKFVTVADDTAFTLGVRPALDVAEALRQSATYSNFAPRTYDRSTILQTSTTSHVNIKATVKNATGPVGLTIAASPDGVEYTNIIYEPSNYTILFDRHDSTTMDLFNRETITGSFQPYTLLSTNETEEISLDVWVDGSAVEFYVNERFALSARIYLSKTCSTGWGVFVGEDSEAEFGKVEAWDGTKNIWPQRPANSSSELVIDTPAETNNGAWWIGN
ncbi:hypothetical protein BST61_g5978 [Cercospora zeina]